MLLLLSALRALLQLMLLRAGVVCRAGSVLDGRPQTMPWAEAAVGLHGKPCTEEEP